MIYYYWFFIPNTGLTQSILYDYRKVLMMKENRPIMRSEEAERCKQNLQQVGALAYPNSENRLAIMIDASSDAVGAVVQQWLDKHWKALSFFSRKLMEAEKNYSTYDRELLAVYTVIKKI